MLHAPAKAESDWVTDITPIKHKKGEADTTPMTNVRYVEDKAQCRNLLHKCLRYSLLAFIEVTATIVQENEKE